MSVPFASFQLIAKQGAYSFVISSCNPAQPVSFQLGDQPYDSSRLEDGGYLGGRYNTVASLVTFPGPPYEATQPNQNPIKLVVFQITPDQGEFTGNSAVFYGYYLQPYGQGLGFYLNQEQSQQNFQYGSSGIPVQINEIAPSITLS